ncbi:MAG: PstS family phosphate ABC transporter substrate-binding protein [Bellilinea sp.]
MKFAARIITLVALLTILAACTPAPGDSNSPSASTYIQNKGSDTIVNLALAWAEAYQTVKPDVRISVTGGGSGTGLTALISGTVDIANASRKIKAEEIQAAEANGIEPVEHVIARDAIAVIVNPENPIGELSLEQIARIYRGEVNNWSELGGEDRPIVRLSRETNSGTHVYFLEEVVRLGDKENKEIFSADTLLLPSSEGIIAEVSDNPNAIGYDGLGYVTPEVKMLAVARTADQPYILPSVESVNNGQYPISRDLYMYTQTGAPQTVLDYLAWILSPQAQQIVTNLGFVPILSTTAGK